MAYATLPELKMVLDKDSSTDDFALQLALDGATRAIESATGRAFAPTASTTRYFDGVRGRRLAVGDVVSVSAVTLATVTGGTPATLASTDYWLGPLARLPGEPYRYLDLSDVGTYSSWAGGFSTIAVTGVWGWPAVPADIKQVCISLAARWFKGAQAGFSDVVGVDPFGTPAFSQQITRHDREILHRYMARDVAF